MNRLVFVVLLCLTNDLLAETDPHRIKGICLAKVSQFIDWPEAPAGPGREFIICILGNSPVLGYAEKLYANRKINDKPVKVVHARTLLDIKHPQILFISASCHIETEKILKVVQQGVLTISEKKGRAESGIHINFTIDKDNKLKLEINLESARRAGFKISHLLLGIARIVPFREAS
jgi:hypothetical protein